MLAPTTGGDKYHIARQNYIKCNKGQPSTSSSSAPDQHLSWTSSWSNLETSHPGRQRSKWLDQIRSDNSLPSADLWRCAIRVEMCYCSSTCICDVSEYVRKVDSRLFNSIQIPSHCLSHLLPPEKQHFGLRPRGHCYALPICPNNLCKRSFIPRCLFCFL